MKLTDEQVIRARHKLVTDGPINDHKLEACVLLDRDLPALLDEVGRLRQIIETCRDALEPIANDSQEANFVFGHLSHYLFTGEVSMEPRMLVGVDLGPEKPVFTVHSQPQVPCPKCGVWEDDFDGLPILAHTKPAYENGCGYCSHPTRDGGVCGICGDIE